MAPATLHDRLELILDDLAQIETLWVGKTAHEFRESPVLIAATERFLEKISEASKYIPDSEKSQHPIVPWREVRALGNVIRHAYDSIDPDRIWNIVANDLTPLRQAIEDILRHANSTNTDID